MFSVYNVIYFIGGSIFYVFAVLIFRFSKQLRFSNDLILGFYFLFTASILPIIGVIPLNPENSSLLHQLLIITSASVPIVFYCLTLFIDYSILDKISLFSMYMSIFLGVILGIFLFGNSTSLDWQPSLFGLYPCLIFLTPLSQIALTLNTLFCISILCRFLWIGLRMDNRQKNLQKRRQIRNFILVFASGPSTWIIISVLKRLFPLLLGLDFGISFIFYLLLFYYYKKYRSIFYFLPNTVEMIIFINRNGIPMFDYNFQTRKLTDAYLNREEEYSLIRNLFYGTTTILDEVFHKQEKLTNINFDHSQIIYLSGEYIRWIIISRSSHSNYYNLFRRIATQIEIKFKQELMQIQTFYVASNELKLFLKNELEEIY